MFEQNESKDVELTPELAALERRLAGLEVAPLQVDRDRLMFEAGRAAARPEWPGYLAGPSRRSESPVATWAGGWFWPTTTAMMTAACVMLAAMLVWRDDAALAAQREAKPQAVMFSKTEAPTREYLRDVERLVAGSMLPNRSMRPAGGYLAQRHMALTHGLAELPSELQGDDSWESADPTEPATARELLRELVPSRGPPGHSNS